MRKHLFFLFCLLLFVFLLGTHVGMLLLPFNTKLLGNVSTTKTDTISVTEYMTRRDTVFFEKPQYYKKVIRDTVFLKQDDRYLLVSQKEYRDSNYVAWVSGIEPQLDSIMVYKNTEYVFKTSTIETIKTIEDKAGKWYVGAGFFQLDKSVVPKANLFYQQRYIMIGASVGLYNNQPIYGVDINFKIK